jgi:hypothetical protein
LLDFLLLQPPPQATDKASCEAALENSSSFMCA